jgi:LysM repeat protein
MLFYNANEDALGSLSDNANIGESDPGYGRDLFFPVAFEFSHRDQPSSDFVYTVQRGDTLGVLARRFGLPLNTLASANGIVNRDQIDVGQQLVIPIAASPTEISALQEYYRTYEWSGEHTLPDWLEVPEPTLQNGKQILVVLSQQTAFAYEDGLLLAHFIVSTGLPATPTVQGNYAIYRKITSQRMSGPGYDLANVPWVMYFYQGYAFHGTYWHNNFGSPMSHGCVNMQTQEAAWLFDWAEIGTAVLVLP